MCPWPTCSARVGVAAGAVEIVFSGADRGVEHGVEQVYQRSLPLDVATGPDALLAYAVNGMPLPPQHGFPLRLVVANWYGMTNVKWLTTVTAVDVPFSGYQQATSYRLRHADEARRPTRADVAAGADGPAGGPGLHQPGAPPFGRAVNASSGGRGRVTHRSPVSPSASMPGQPGRKRPSTGRRSRGSGSPGPTPGTRPSAPTSSAAGPSTPPATSSRRARAGTSAATSTTRCNEFRCTCPDPSAVSPASSGCRP